jgi:TP901 family phage tail tape measure protein
MSIDTTTLSITVVSTGVKEASAAIGGLSTSAANAEKRIQALTAATQQLSTINSASANAMAGYMAKLQQQATLMQNLAGASAGAAMNVQQLAAAMALLSASLNLLNQQMQQQQIRQRQSNELMRDGQAAARGLSGSLGALWMTYGAFTGMAVGLAIGASLKGIIVVGKDVENTLESIRVKGQETIESVNAIRESVMSLGQGIYGPQQVAKAFETLILAGKSAKEALSGIADALNLATIGGTSIEKSAYTIVQVGTALGYSADNYSRIADVIAMTAAASMSSVESLSEAFKSGSAVGKLYGITLVDIGTSLAALSNLGIQGSAAGTSLKNFYKELAAESGKVTGTLKAMKLSPESFKDDEGNYKGLLQVVETLATGLDGLTGQAQKLALANLSNERGMKTVVEVLDLYRQKVEKATEAGTEHTNMLALLRSKIEESYGFAAIGAAQMSLTVENQFKSVANTLQTVFIKAFQSVSPELSIVATEMKSAFNSPEFITAISSIALGVARFTVLLVENIPLVVKLFEALLAYKAAAFLVGMLVSVAEGMVAIKAAMDLARISAIAFQASLGLIGVALLAAGAAYVYFTNKRDESNMSNTQKTAIQYSKDYANALDEEAKRLETQIEMMRRGKTARDAETDSIYKQNLALADLKRTQAINEGQTRFAAAAKNVTPTDISEAEKIVKQGGMMRSAVREYKEAQESLLAVTKAANAEFDRVAVNQDRVMKAAKTKEELRIAQEKAAADKAKSTGTGTLDKGPSKSTARDIYGAEIQDYQNQINAQKKILEQTKLATQSAYKQGLIGERGLIEENYTAEVTAAKAVIGLLQSKVAMAEGAENKRRMAMKYTGEIQAQQAAIDAAESARNRANAEWLVSNETRIQKAEAERYTAQGKFVAAYEAEFGAKRDVRIKGIQADLLTEVNAVRKASGEKVLASYESEQAAGRAQAQEKEYLKSFMDLANETRNALKGVQTASEGQGLAAMFTAAQAASETLAVNMDELRNRMGMLVDPKDINEAQAQMTNLAESQRKLWSGVGESIGKSLTSAFGKGGKATADLIKIGQNYANLEDKTGDARIKAYGDAAGAAKGYFEEGSAGYKVMETAEKAFRLIELAGMAKSLAMNISNAAATAAAWVPAVFASFMASLGPWGTAAAAVALAAVGIAAFGGSGTDTTSADRQKTQGTGSVLGMNDAKSESIVNSLAIMEKNSGLGLAQGNQMVSYLRNVSDNIVSLSSLIVQSTGITGNMGGDSLGAASKVGSMLSVIPLVGKAVGKLLNSIFGGNTTVTDTGFTAAKTSVGAGTFNASQFTDKTKDGGWFSSDKKSTDLKSLGADANNQFAGIVQNMAASLRDASKLLGVDGAAFNAKLNSFVVDIGKISLKGMSGDEIQSTLQAVFSKLGDDMAKFAFTDFAAFQKVGEGFLETITRVANDVMQVKDVFAVLGKSFQLTGTAAATVAENLITAAGSLDKLTENTKYFVDNFLTEAERMGPITASVQNVMAQLGYSTVDTIEEFSKLVRSLDLTDPASQQLYGTLLSIAPAFKDAADYATKLAEGTVTLTKTQQKLLDAVSKAKSVLQDSYNSESSALQGVIDKTKSFIATLGAYQNSLKLGNDSPLTNMQKYAEAKKQFEAISVAAMNGDATAQAGFTAASSALLAASKVVNASGQAYTNDFDMVQTIIDRLMGSATVQVDVAQASLDALNKQVQGLFDINKSVMSVTDAIIALQTAIAQGTAGGLTGAQMETTYTPTAAQVAAATPASSSNGGNTVTTAQPVVVAIQANTEAILAQTAAQSAQAGVMVGAVYGAAEDTANTVGGSVSGLGGLIRSAANKVRLV